MTHALARRLPSRVGDNARGLDADIGLFGRFFYPVRSARLGVLAGPFRPG